LVNLTAIAPLPGWPQFDDDEIDAVSRCLRSGRVNYWTGEEGRSFETEYAAMLGRRHTIALANGTLALELALKVWGIGPGDEVVVTPRSFMASASCVVTQGANPIFVDVDRDSGNITARTIEPALTKRTKAIIPVHLAGWPCEMDEILELARSRGIRVLEDCAQAHGATYRGRPVGSVGDGGAFSFCQDKIITTGGEGGLLAVDDDQWWDAAWSYKDHGKTMEAVYRRQHDPGYRWLHDRFGSNWRMTEMQAAIGRLQLRKLAAWSAARARNAQILIDALSRLSALRVPIPPPHSRHAWYKFHCYVRPNRLRSDWNRERVMCEISARGITCLSGSCSELYLEAAFSNHATRPATRLPIARDLGETSLTFLVHPTLTADDMHRICDVVKSVVNEASA
jgi:dTDP-4-amino-4,6-dideoxygalactose transaminase